MARNVTFAPKEYYHIYNRGTDKRTVFEDKADSNRLVALLYLCNSSENVRLANHLNPKSPVDLFATKRSGNLVDICAYCLMPNHFHILLREKREGGVSLFMQKLTTAYTMYFNTRHERAGNLFQGVFKAKHADNDQYLKYLIAYIHLNPVKIIDPTWKDKGISDRGKAQEYLEKYEHSSYLDYLGIQRRQNSVIARGALPEYFSAPTSFRESVKEWLSFSEE